MFNHLRNQARLINKAANNPKNRQKAKKLKTKLAKIGKPLLIIGAIWGFASFIVLMIVSFSTFNTNSFNVIGVVISFVLMIVFSLMATCGFSLFSISRGINSLTTVQDMIIDEKTKKIYHKQKNAHIVVKIIAAQTALAIIVVQI